MERTKEYLVDIKAMNSIIKEMAKRQNAKSKMNAGQLREAVKLFLDSSVHIYGRYDIRSLSIVKAIKQPTQEYYD